MSQRLLAVVLVATLAAPLGGARHGETCSAVGAQPALPVGSAFAFWGTLTPANGFPYQGGQPHKWTMTLGPGEHYLAMESTDPYPTYVVCREGDTLNRHFCSDPFSTWPWFPSTCLLGVGFSGSPIVCPVSCNAVVYVTYCMGTFCGWPVDVPVVAYAGVVDRWPL